MQGIDPVAVRNAENALAARMFFEYKDPAPSLVGAPVLRVIPNPSAGPIVIEAAAGVQIEVFDVSGRRVARLGGSAEGARWDGRDETGRPAPSGIYYCRPAGSSGEITPITLVR
jgi:hypothetical protein